MIDIHSHIIPFVDDGSVDLESSLALIEDAIKQGVETIILTPHYRSRFRLPKEKINSAFEKLTTRKIIGCNPGTGYYILTPLNRDIITRKKDKTSHIVW